MFQKLGSPLPQLKRKVYHKGKKAPFTGAIQHGWTTKADTRKRLERFASLSKTAVGTLPERAVQFILEKKKFTFTPQFTVPGARLDFMVAYGPPPGLAIRVAGEYWHNLPGRVASDAVQELRLRSQGFSILTIWELELYDAILNGSVFTWFDEKIARLSSQPPQS